MSKVIPLLGYYIETRNTERQTYTQERVMKAHHYAHKKKFDGFPALMEAQISLHKMLTISDYDTQAAEIIAEVMESQTAFGQTADNENNVLNAVVNAMAIDFTKRVEKVQKQANVFGAKPKPAPKR